MTFKELGIIQPILKALEAKGYTHPTPIQAKSIPILLKGEDLLGCAQTGTGKTAAFGIPILQHIYNKRQPGQKGRRKIKALVVTPTRELAIQIGENFTEYGEHAGVRNTVIFGGVKQAQQTRILRQGVDILVATPGRLLDLINQGFISLRDLEYFVLDEADQMLDMGFIHDIKKILKLLPAKRQSLFFSATMPQSIRDLSGKILGNPGKVTITPEKATADKIEQGVYFVAKKNKTKLLVHILEERPKQSTLVFSRTKHGANKIVKQLGQAGIKSEAIHGNKSQTARQKALGKFKSGELFVLVATDIAARGIDVSKLALVVNYDLPNISETYVHRIGRTGRAKESGIALSFCNQEEKEYLRDIQKLINQKVPVISEHPFEGEIDEAPAKKEKPKPRPKRKFSKPKPKNGENSSTSRSRNFTRNNPRNKKRTPARARSNDS